MTLHLGILFITCGADRCCGEINNLWGSGRCPARQLCRTQVCRCLRNCRLRFLWRRTVWWRGGRSLLRPVRIVIGKNCCVGRLAGHVCWQGYGVSQGRGSEESILKIRKDVQVLRTTRANSIPETSSINATQKTTFTEKLSSTQSGKNGRIHKECKRRETHLVFVLHMRTFAEGIEPLFFGIGRLTQR